MHQDKDHSLIQFFLDLLESFFVFKKFIIGSVLIVVSICVVLVQWVIPPKYDANATLIPSSNGNSGSLQKAMGKLGGNIMSEMMGFSLGDIDDKDLFQSIYNSKVFGEKVIQAMNLREHFKMDEDAFFMDVMKEYRKNSLFSISDQDAIELRYRSEDTLLALNTVKYTIQLLDSSYNALKQTGIDKKLSYIRNRLIDMDSLERHSQEALAQYQKKHGIYDVEAQLESSISAIADLEMKKSIIEIEASYELAQQGKETHKYQKLKDQIRHFSKRINHMQNKANPNSVLLAVKGDALKLIEYQRLMREVKVNSGVYAFLRQRAEQLELDQQTGISHLNIIDAPWVADKKATPSKRGIVMVGFGLSYVISQSIAFFLFVYRREDDTHPYKAQLQKIFKKA